MNMKDNTIYRKEALDRLSIPQKLDKSLPVTKPLYWLALLGAVIILTILLLWGFFGYINVTLDVSGICYTPGYANQYLCEDTGIVTQVTEGQGNFVVAGDPIYEYKDSPKSNSTKTWKTPVTGLITSLSIYPGTEIYPGKDAITIKAFVHETVKGSVIVDEVPGHDPNQSYYDYTKKAYLFVPISNFGQIQIGQQAEIWPNSSDKYAHGHMIGTIDYINAFIASDEDIKSVIGLDQEISDFEQMGNLGICELSLQKDPETESGFYWTSPNGKNITIAEGDVVNASIIISRVHPISLLFPGL